MCKIGSLKPFYYFGQKPKNRLFPTSVNYFKLKKVEDDRDGKWYYGALATTSTSWGYEYPGVGYDLNFKLHCVAMADDGTKLHATSHNRHFAKEADRTGWRRSQFLVVGADDGSKWADWSEWSPCSQTCGYQSERSKTRACVDSAGNEIDYKTGFNCIADIKVRSQTSWSTNYDVLTDTEVADCDQNDFMETCPYWGSWKEEGECSATCGGGILPKNRKCLCEGYPDSRVLNKLSYSC